RNPGENLFNQVAVGIKDGDAFSILDVLNDQVQEEGGLAGTGCADDVGVTQTLLHAGGHWDGFAGTLILSENQAVSGCDRRCRFGFSVFAFQLGGAHTRRWQMNKRDQFIAVEKNTGTSATTIEEIINMRSIIVAIVRKRNEFVTARVSELTKCLRHTLSE